VNEHFPAALKFFRRVARPFADQSEPGTSRALILLYNRGSFMKDAAPHFRSA
jgi:hypothetical protein